MQAEFALLQRCVLAVAIGLLIGIERGWQERQARDGARVAGIRTFTLIGVLGGICGLLSQGAAASILGLSFLAFALPFGWFEWQHARLARTVSATDYVAGLLTFALGAYAVRGNMMIAAAAGVTTAIVLAERQLMHSFLRGLQWSELRAGLILLVMTAILLPALPDRTLDPLGALNPHEIWLMTVLTGSVCYGGYIAIRLAGERRGLLYAGIMGGLATSTTVTWTFARLAKRDIRRRASVLTAILAAWIISLLRMTLLATVLAPAVGATMAGPIAAAIAVLLIGALASYRTTAAKTQSSGLLLSDPLELPLVLQFTVVLAVVMLLTKWISAHVGSSGLFAFGGASGVLDVDPITLSMARLARTGFSTAAAAGTILAAGAANGIAKSVLGLVFGGLRLGLILTGLMLAAVAAGASAFFL